MTRLFLIFAAANGFLSVALGAFAAHGLKAKVSAYNLEVLNTASEYQMTHSLCSVGRLHSANAKNDGHIIDC